MHRIPVTVTYEHIFGYNSRIHKLIRCIFHTNRADCIDVLVTTYII